MTLDDMEDDPSPLAVLRELLITDRVFYETIRLLEGHTRNQVVAGQLRNSGLALQILRTAIDQPTPSLVMNIDLSGNVLRNFLDPVPVVATYAQVVAGTETGVLVSGPTEACSICRDPLVTATRIRACGHCFHAECINQWFGVNTRCPVCRHDIRTQATQAAYGAADNSTQ